MNRLTVFVLGAGSSAPYGLPLADKLADGFAESVGALGIMRAERLPQQIPGNRGTMAMQEAKRKTLALSNRIRRSRTETIDAFIADAPEIDSTLLTHAMIDVLWDKENDVAKQPERLKDGGDWIAWLYNNRLKRKPDEFVHNKAVFVSFNYDRLPRILLSTMMANRYRIDIGACWEKVGRQVVSEDGTNYDRFIHVHGSISTDPIPSTNEPFLNCQYSRENLEAASDGITIPGIASQADPSDAHNLAGLWRRAKRIYFLGFGYHQSLLDELFIDDDLVTTLDAHNTLVAGTAYKFTGLQREAVKIRLGNAFFLADSEHDNLVFLQHRLKEGD